MKLTHEALLVQKNASQLINELLSILDEMPEGYRTDGDSLSDLYADEDVWDVNNWEDEETMNEYRMQIFVLRKLFDMSETIENQSYRSMIATRNVEKLLPDSESKEMMSDLKSMFNL